MAARARRPLRTTAIGAGESGPAVRHSAPRQWTAAIGLALLCLAAYSNSFQTGFALDSRQLVLNDARVHALSADNLSLIARHSYWWPYGESGLYRPLTTFSYLFNFAVIGNRDSPSGYHWFNLLLHIANVLMLWRLAVRLTRNQWVGVSAAAIWAVAPLSTEAVTNIAGRADLLAAAGTLAAVLLYLRARDAGAPGKGLRAYGCAAGAAVAATAGILSKESAVTVLGVFVLCEFLWWSGTRSVRTLVLVGAACTLPVMWWLVQRQAVIVGSQAAEFPFTDNPITGAGFWQGRVTAIHVVWQYLWLLVWPNRLSNDYSYGQIPLASMTTIDWASSALLIVGGLAATWQARRNREVLFFMGVSFITFLPASNLLFATGTIMGERLVYLPSGGLAVLLALGLSWFARSDRRRRGATSCVVLVVAALGARTYARNPDWTNDVTLWRSAVAAAPASAKAHRALAEALYDSDPTHANLDAVIVEADRSIVLLDALPDEHNTFQAFRQAGAYYLEKANRLEGSTGGPDPEPMRAYSRSLKLLDRAVLIARAGARMIPGGSVEPEADAQRLRAAALLGRGDPPLALAAATRSRELSPLHPLAYRLSAGALLEMKRSEEAVITLLAGGIVSGDASLGQQAMSLYANGLDPDGCAVTGEGRSAALNPNCPIVARDSCSASAAAIQILKNAGQNDRAGQTKAAAMAALGCAADVIERGSSTIP
jgi:hypothetical protein